VLLPGQHHEEEHVQGGGSSLLLHLRRASSGPVSAVRLSAPMPLWALIQQRWSSEIEGNTVVSPGQSVLEAWSRQ
jgi:hypothetical protein